MGRLRESRSRSRIEDSRGFSFLELLVALAATVIVMGVVFGLLAQGSGAHTEELERSDLQAQARAALQMLSQDVLLAGGDLPPELPALRPVVGVMGTRTADGIEILGNFESDAGGAGAVPVASFDGRIVRLAGDTVRFQRGDLVLVYDDHPTDGKWMFGLVDSVERGPRSELSLLTGAGERIDDVDRPIALPLTIDDYNRPTPESGFVTPITVIGYGLGNDFGLTSDRERSSLWRQVNWGERVDVAYVEDMEIRYFVGGTVADPVVPTPKTSPRGGPTIFSQGQGRAKDPDPGRPPSNPSSTNRARAPNGEFETQAPPSPQPEPGRVIQEQNLIRGVRIAVTTRSQAANLRGSSLDDGQTQDEAGYVRETFSTRVAPRNLLIQAERRRQQLDAAEMMTADPTSPPRPRSR